MEGSVLSSPGKSAASGSFLCRPPFFLLTCLWSPGEIISDQKHGFSAMASWSLLVWESGRCVKFPSVYSHERGSFAPQPLASLVLQGWEKADLLKLVKTRKAVASLAAAFARAGRWGKGPSSSSGAIPSAVELQKPGKGLLMVGLGLGGDVSWWSYREGIGGWWFFREVDVQGQKPKGIWGGMSDLGGSAINCKANGVHA